MTAMTYADLEDRYRANNYSPMDIVIRRAEGSWVWDTSGKKYLDFVSAYSSVNQGHCHPRIRQAMIEQADLVTLTSYAVRHEHLGRMCKKLSELSGLPKVLPMNSGAEAVETALKAIRKWAYTIKGIPDDQAEIIVCQNGFSGRTISAVSLSDTKQNRFGFGPLTPGFRIIPFGDAAALREAITPVTAAFFLEPIQGEGGIIIPPRGFLQEAEETCRTHGVLLVLDEIQTGLGRTGKMFAFQHEGVTPDGITVGKSLSGGFYPISAFVSTDAVMGVFQPGDHGSTFGGNPLAARIACAALDVLIDERLVERSAELGDYFLQRLQTMRSKHVKDIRGRGLFIGLELFKTAGGGRRFCDALLQEAVLARETREHIIRLTPPLVISRDEIDWAVERITRALATL
jgi:ornithine--oxo-acid transaminase